MYNSIFFYIIIIIIIIISILLSLIYKTKKETFANYNNYYRTSGSGIVSSIIPISGVDEGYLSFTGGTTDLTLTSAITCDILVVGGGGGAGSRHGGGGGGGAVIYLTNQTLNAGTYSITIGTGGTASGTGAGNYGKNGGDTSIVLSGTNIYLAKGGGAASAGIDRGRDGLSGGSGAGGTGDGGGGDGAGGKYSAGGSAVTTNVPTGAYGYSGGKGYPLGPWAGGGGGGGGGAGTDASSSAGGNGGAGKLVTIKGTNEYYGGGGGGGVQNGYTAGTGGIGGGGNGGAGASNGANGTANTGGGGGGGGYRVSPDYSGTGGTGGSGIVIIRIKTIAEEEAKKAAERAAEKARKEAEAAAEKRRQDMLEIIKQDAADYNKDIATVSNIEITTELYSYPLGNLKKTSLPTTPNKDNNEIIFRYNNSDNVYKFTYSSYDVNYANNTPLNLFNGYIDNTSVAVITNPNVDFIGGSFSGHEDNSYDLNSGIYKGKTTTTINGESIAGETIFIKAPSPFFIRKYGFIAIAGIENYAPGKWVLYGTNDNTTYTLIDDSRTSQLSRNNYLNKYGWYLKTIAASQIAYSGYRFIFTATATTNKKIPNDIIKYNKLNFSEITIYGHP